jgi:hypothetical protein
LFAAVGRYDQIVKAITERFGGLTDALNARANAAQPGPLRRDLIQDIRRIPHAFQGFRRAADDGTTVSTSTDIPCPN